MCRREAVRTSRRRISNVLGFVVPVLLGVLPIPLAAENLLTVQRFAGNFGGAGADDGVGTRARFNSPYDVAVDGSGNVYVADYANNTVRKIAPGGLVTTLAGRAGSLGIADGTGSEARFAYLAGIAVDANSNLYVADYYVHAIRMVTPEGVVTTLAGGAYLNGSADGTGSAARFYHPTGVTVDSAGNLYVADSGNHTIRKVTSAGAVTTIAGLAGVSGLTDGTGTEARFNSPWGIHLDPSETSLYVGDYLNHTIRKIVLAGAVVSTFAGLAGSSGSTDGSGSAARFSYPCGVAVDTLGFIYVADSVNNSIRKITSGGAVSTFAGSAGSSGSADGGSTARFSFPTGVAVDRSGTVYVAERANHTIRQISAGGETATLAGMVAAAAGSADGTGGAARFNWPLGVAVDPSGSVFVADSSNYTIRKVTPGGVVSTLAGKAAVPGTSDGAGTAARFSVPSGVAVDPSSGDVYVADSWNNSIRKVTPAGAVSTLAGLSGTAGYANGDGTAARFDRPTGIGFGTDGHLYVADSYNHVVRKVTLAGTVTLFAGIADSEGSADGPAASAQFRYPADVLMDGSGTLYVADNGNRTLRQISGGNVSTLAGGGTGSSPDGVGKAAWFNALNRLALEASGSLLVTDQNSIRRVRSDGTTTTVAGSSAWAYTDGTGQVARLSGPVGIAVAPTGVVYIADSGNNALRRAAVGSRLADFDGDRKADVAVFRSSSGSWFVVNSTGGSSVQNWGLSGDVPVVGDFDGDGRMDYTVFRPSTGTWFVLKSGSGNAIYVASQWGQAGDVPMAGDYDGDGKADLAVFRPSTGTWFVLNSTGGSTARNWGMSGDTPVVGDFDGDGKADLAVFRPSTGTWFVLKSGSGYTTFDAVSWGQSGDVPEPGDYDGDGKTDVAVFRPSTGVWFVVNSTGGYTARNWGMSGDVPQPADYDGDGRTDPAVFRPSTGTWFILKSGSGYTTYDAVPWGVSTDTPVTAPVH